MSNITGALLPMYKLDFRLCEQAHPSKPNEYFLLGKATEAMRTKEPLAVRLANDEQIGKTATEQRIRRLSGDRGQKKEKFMWFFE